MTPSRFISTFRKRQSRFSVSQIASEEKRPVSKNLGRYLWWEKRERERLLYRCDLDNVPSESKGENASVKKSKRKRKKEAKEEEDFPTSIREWRKIRSALTTDDFQNHASSLPCRRRIFIYRKKIIWFRENFTFFYLISNNNNNKVIFIKNELFIKKYEVILRMNSWSYSNFRGKRNAGAINGRRHCAWAKCRERREKEQTTKPHEKNQKESLQVCREQ